MGLGVSPLLAERTANAGVGPLTVTATGSSYATGYFIKNAQYFIVVNAGSTGFLSLPVVGSDNGALFADDYIIANNSGGNITIAAPSGVTIIGAGGSGTTVVVANNTVNTLWAGPTTTTWVYK
jgi:hypothetical protein